jgi:hypothetical protein
MECYRERGNGYAVEPHRERKFSVSRLNESLIRGCGNEIATGKTGESPEKIGFFGPRAVPDRGFPS